MADPVASEPQHSEAEEQYLQELYDQLEPEARAQYVNYFLARTPAHLQEDMKDLVEENFPNPPDPPPPEEPPVAR